MAELKLKRKRCSFSLRNSLLNVSAFELNFDYKQRGTWLVHILYGLIVARTDHLRQFESAHVCLISNICIYALNPIELFNILSMMFIINGCCLSGF